MLQFFKGAVIHGIDALNGSGDEAAVKQLTSSRNIAALSCTTLTKRNRREDVAYT